jgi:YegS/Rv2252/BmrU family lipid kinase
MTDLAAPTPTATGDPEPAASTGATAIALVVNPAKADDCDALAASVADHCRRLGLPAPSVLPTSNDDPGQGPARQAIDAGARLVLAAGGDGTVRAVAEALAGTDVALGVLPLGTGNLLARNLDLPMDLDGAITVALTGADRRIDVGRLDDGAVFAVMAGAGFDAAMMRAAPEGMKDAIGWPAYLVGGARSLRRARVTIELRLDDQPPRTERIRTVLVGNMGKLQGGLELLPDAVPDDGKLDVVVVSPRRAVDWLVLLGRALRRDRRRDHRMRTFQARTVDVRMQRAEPRQVDGDLIEPALHWRAEVVPGALTVRVRRHDDAAGQPPNRKAEQ